MNIPTYTPYQFTKITPPASTTDIPAQPQKKTAPTTPEQVKKIGYGLDFDINNVGVALALHAPIPGTALGLNGTFSYSLAQASLTDTGEAFSFISSGSLQLGLSIGLSDSILLCPHFSATTLMARTLFTPQAPNNSSTLVGGGVNALFIIPTNPTAQETNAITGLVITTGADIFGRSKELHNFFNADLIGAFSASLHYVFQGTPAKLELGLGTTIYVADKIMGTADISLGFKTPTF